MGKHLGQHQVKRVKLTPFHEDPDLYRPCPDTPTDAFWDTPPLGELGKPRATAPLHPQLQLPTASRGLKILHGNFQK